MDLIIQKPQRNEISIDNYDAVFCSRYKDGAKSPDDTPIRALAIKSY